MTAGGDPAYRQAAFGGGYGLMTFHVDEIAEMIIISTSHGSADCPPEPTTHGPAPRTVRVRTHLQHHRDEPADPAERQRPGQGVPLVRTPTARRPMRYCASLGGSPRSCMQGAITHLIAGVPVSELGAAIDWYTRLFGRPPDLRAGEEILWDIDEHATLFIEPDAARAGAGRITLAVAGLDALLERLATEGIEHEPIETYSNGVRHVKVPDPDGNAIAFAELPQS
jgi:catechol 2,3-dioxygenase-like lactoylglutathione lyase family enzyme